MAGFDISTAKPVGGGFDISTAQPIAQQPAIEQSVEQAPQDNDGFNPYTDIPKIATDAFSRYIKEPAETAISMAGGIVAESVAGLTGLASLPFVDSEQADKNIKAVREAMAVTPPSEGGKALLGSIAQQLQPVGEGIKTARKFIGDPLNENIGPLAGALGQATPDALLSMLGLKLPIIKSKTALKPKRVEPTIKETKPATYEELGKSLKAKNEKKIALEVKPDAEILKAADDLGVVLNPSAYSKNYVYRQTEQALKDRPGSKLGAVEERAIIDLGANADKLIKDIGGATDKSMLDFAIKDQITAKITKLETSAEKAYKAIDEAIPKQTLVKAENSKKYLQQTLDDLGGDALRLTPAEKSLSSLVNSEKPATYAALDRIRKDVGSGFKGKGVFKDVNEASLKQVYKALGKDQADVALAFGVGETYELAKNLVKTRKGLEDSAKTLLGKELQNSIVPKLTQAATGLTKGDVSKFTALMKTVPKNRRAEVAATMLNDLFNYGARSKGSLGQGFVNAYKGLNRNKAAKDILFKNLPTEARIRFNKIGKVTEGLYRAKALENKSRTAASIIAALDDGGLISKIYGSTLKKIPGSNLVKNAVETVLNKASPATKSADSMLTSPAFRRSIEVAARGDIAKANKIMESTPIYKRWLKDLPKEHKSAIAAEGVIAWLTNTTNQNQKVK